jgi:glucose/arabinose dehydrogenase
VVDPQVQWHTAEASPSGIAYADGAIWMAALRGERLWRIEVSGNRVSGQPEAFFTGDYGRLRTVEAAPDGSLWLTTSNTDGRGAPAENDDRILRLTLD